MNGKVEMQNDFIDPIKKLEEIFKEKGYYEKYPVITITQIDENIFAIQTTQNVSLFVDAKGEVIINLKGIVDSIFYKKASILAGFIEEKIDGEDILYRVSGAKLNNGISKPEKGDSIDKYSLEYFNARMSISFFEFRLWIKTLLISDEGGYSKLNNEFNLTKMLESLAIKIEDLEQLRSQGQISNEMFTELLKLYQGNNGILIQQIGNKNFAKDNESITKEEIQNYFDKGYISKDLYEIAIEILTEFQKNEKEKEKKSVGLVDEDLDDLWNSIQ